MTALVEKDGRKGKENHQPVCGNAEKVQKERDYGEKKKGRSE